MRDGRPGGHGLRYHPCDSNITFFFGDTNTFVALDPLFCFDSSSMENREYFNVPEFWEWVKRGGGGGASAWDI